ncbi:MAG: pilus assembly protein PilY [Nitrospirae bacterium]|nr:MAG: pilus assembly protein PilY [Nitrospirota bacterium]
MKTAYHIKMTLGLLLLAISLLLPFGPEAADAAVMNDYCIVPPFVSQASPPLVMFEVGREHKLYYEAYNDSADLDDDGLLDIDYKHSIDYYGYFDPYKCYTFSSGIGGGTNATAQFNPIRVTTDKFCSGAIGEWSGNVLNWLTMSRMDVLKKVLYGGRRTTDNNSETILERVYVPQDAHSWGKELTGRLCRYAGVPDLTHPQYTYSCVNDGDCLTGYTCEDKSLQLIGTNAADPQTPCSSAVTVNWNATDKVGLVLYDHDPLLPDNIAQGNTSSELFASYDPTKLVSYNLISGFDSVAGATGLIDAQIDHRDNYNWLAVAEFKFTTNAERGDWYFAVDGDDGVEVEIFSTPTTAATTGTVVASYYGGHSSCFAAAGGPNATSTNFCPGQVFGFKNLPTRNVWWRIVVRHTEKAGQDGVRLWYKKPGAAAWALFNSTNLGAGNLRAPTITAANNCSIKAEQFIKNGVPTTGSSLAKRHLFCSTTLSDGGTSILRKLENSNSRIWNWASKERPVCDSSLGAPVDFAVRVKVCDTGIGVESNCKSYTGTYKPTGLLQKYGEGDGSKICSKYFSKVCNADTDCTAANNAGVDLGLCIDKNQMYFGLITDSYIKNLSGGVLRKNVGSILDETNINNGIFQTSENVQGNIIITMDRLTTIGYSYASNAYDAASGGPCGWITTRGLQEGECRMWGNPIGEMMYEGLRHFAGKATPTPEFTYATPADSGVNLSKPAWGYPKGATTLQPYEMYPACSKPFILVMSDVNTSYDSDQIPGSSFNKTDGTKFTEDVALPQLGLGDTVSSGRTLLNELLNTIGTTEGIIGNNWFVGENGTTKDFMCTSKPVTDFSQVRGICPEEPTKQGSYYSAAVAYYGHTQFKAKTGKTDVDTYAVALSSPFADLKIKTSVGEVTFVPMGKTVSGCLSAYTACAQKCTLTYDAAGHGLSISNCAANAYCPTNQIVDFYVDDIRYDASKNVIYAKFRINYEDVEQGADHDMDAIVSYELCTQAAVAASLGSCTGALGPNDIKISLASEYAAGCIDQALGFIISGVGTDDGTYLPVKDADIDSDGNSNVCTANSGSDGDTPGVVANMQCTWSKTFTATGSASDLLKSPLWYAAKWGGFDDKNGDKIPDSPSEWDVDGNGVPDNYFLVVNPLKLERQLENALLSILRRASSGTAASVLASGEGSGANMIQAIFYPKRITETVNNTELDWIGTLQNFWFFVDPGLGRSTIREDSDQNMTMALESDKIAKFFFDTADQRTKASLYLSDSAGNKGALSDTVFIEDMKNLWEAGRKLWAMDPTGRKIYTTTTGAANSQIELVAGNASIRAKILAASDAEADNVVNFVRGTDIAGLRTRTTGLDLSVPKNNNITDAGESPKVWKLGDIVSSTPKIVSWLPLNRYDKTYSDTTYKLYVSSQDYRSRGTVFTGANDGMLHAFNLGMLEVIDTGTSTKGKLCDKADASFDAGRGKYVCSGSANRDNLGKEQWAFVPKNVLPYLKYLADTKYCHLYYVDATPFILDASIGIPAACTETDYWKCAKTQESWRTILIGSMRLGGACSNAVSSLSVQTPAANEGFSSYFALDITDAVQHPDDLALYPPKLLWEFTDPTLGFATAGPAVVRLNWRTPPAVAGGKSTAVDGNANNGKWHVVLASGPTGPIDTSKHQFKGYSNQPLRLFVLDLKSGALLRTINSGITNAFAGSLNNTSSDLDKDYQDDVVYIGYVKSEKAVPDASTYWSQGGVLRLLTMEDLDGDNLITTVGGTTGLNPGNWETSRLIDDVGPVTSAVTHTTFVPTGNLPSKPTEAWAFFGTGRYFFQGDDLGSQRALFGLKDPCLNADSSIGNVRRMLNVEKVKAATPTSPICRDGVNAATSEEKVNYCSNVYTPCTCAVGVTCMNLAPTKCGDLYNATEPIDLPSVAGRLTLNDIGWYINLESPNNCQASSKCSTDSGECNRTVTAERVITDPLVTPQGGLFFTTFAPSQDICKFGGTSFVWALTYNMGSSYLAAGDLLSAAGTHRSGTTKGKAFLQVSTGEIVDIDFAQSFGHKYATKGSSTPDAGTFEIFGRRSDPILGMPPTGQGLSVEIPPTPIDRIMHIRKK